MSVRILVMCAFGEDISQDQIDYWYNGKLEKRSVSYSLRETLTLLVNRLSQLHVFYFPFLADKFITPFERDIHANALILRNKVG